LNLPPFYIDHVWDPVVHDHQPPLEAVLNASGTGQIYSPAPSSISIPSATHFHDRNEAYPSPASSASTLLPWQPMTIPSIVGVLTEGDDQQPRQSLPASSQTSGLVTSESAQEEQPQGHPQVPPLSIVTQTSLQPTQTSPQLPPSLPPQQDNQQLHCIEINSVIGSLESPRYSAEFGPTAPQVLHLQ
ncbi:hypothetical protein BGZ94_001148, partial [Podila epigama]